MKSAHIWTDTCVFCIVWRAFTIEVLHIPSVGNLLKQTLKHMYTYTHRNRPIQSLTLTHKHILSRAHTHNHYVSRITRCHRFESALWSSLYTQLSGVCFFSFFIVCTTNASSLRIRSVSLVLGSVLFWTSNRKPFEVCIGKVANERNVWAGTWGGKVKQPNLLTHSVRKRTHRHFTDSPTLSRCVHAFAYSQCVYINSLKNCS